MSITEQDFIRAVVLDNLEHLTIDDILAKFKLEERLKGLDEEVWRKSGKC